MSPIAEERRAHGRHLVKLRVAVKDAGTLRELHATDLSKGGIFVASRRALPIGERVSVKLVHPVTAEVFEIDAVVANVRCTRGGDVQGCGLRFEPFDDEARADLLAFVEGVVEPEAASEPPNPEAEELADDLPEAPASDASAEALRAHALMLRGLTLSRTGNLVGAAHLLVRAVSLAPEEEGLWKVLRQLEARLEAAAEGRGGRPVSRVPGEADGATRKRASAHPGARKARLLFDEARSRYQEGDFAGATERLEAALEADPDHAPALYALAGLLAERGDDLGRALELCRRAALLDPDNADYRDALRSLEDLTS